MPAIITHHLFGEDAANLLPEGILEGEEELLAFLLGNQGPDPLLACFSALPQHARQCHQLASDMHDGKVVDTLWTLRDAVSHLPEEDARIGRAWAYGFVGHYALDSTAHPLVYAEQNALIEAGEGLAGAASEVHAIIESDIDVWMLRELRNLSIDDVPAWSYLARTTRIDRVAGALVAQVAMQVYGCPLGAAAYGGAVADYERVYKVIDPSDAMRTKTVAGLEKLGRSHSYLRALSHARVAPEECPAANLACDPWVNPATGETRADSFPDLYHLALERWERMVRLLAEGNREALTAECAGINFDGMPDEG